MSQLHSDGIVEGVSDGVSEIIFHRRVVSDVIKKGLVASGSGVIVGGVVSETIGSYVIVVGLMYRTEDG